MRLLIAGLALLLTHAAAAEYRLSTVASGLRYPWSLCFLSSTEMLVTERVGNIRRVTSDGIVSQPIRGMPKVFFEGQGGLFDIMLDPDYQRNKLLYFSYAHGNRKSNATRVARARLDGLTLRDLEVLLTVHPDKNTAHHFGGRLAFLPDHTLLLTSGEGFDFREQAQDLRSQLGKVLRFNRDGSIPKDNPYAGRATGDPRVWTYGHRNPQGLVVDTKSGTVYLHEHGPRGGDEVNVLKPGLNYGWPAATHGVDYNGATISPFKNLPGMRDPIHVWVPSIAPSGLAIYHGAAFPQWEGNLFVGALVNRDVRRLVLVEGKVVSEHREFGELKTRIRDVRLGPDGLLYLLTDEPEGRLVRVDPAPSKVDSSKAPGWSVVPQQ